MLLGTLGGESVLQPFLFIFDRYQIYFFIFISFVPSIRSGQCREGLWQRLRSTAGADGALSPDGCRTECGDDMRRMCLPVPFVDFLTGFSKLSDIKLFFPSFFFLILFSMTARDDSFYTPHASMSAYVSILPFFCMFTCLNFALVNKSWLSDQGCLLGMVAWMASILPM